MTFVQPPVLSAQRARIDSSEGTLVEQLSMEVTANRAVLFGGWNALMGLFDGTTHIAGGTLSRPGFEPLSDKFAAPHVFTFVQLGQVQPREAEQVSR